MMSSPQTNGGTRMVVDDACWFLINSYEYGTREVLVRLVVPIAIRLTYSYNKADIYFGYCAEALLLMNYIHNIESLSQMYLKM
jgi:hypothetical protein